MSVSIAARRSVGLAAVTVLLGTMTACASEPAMTFVAPTMAPDQSVSEACAISSEQVDRITQETEAQLRAGIEQAGNDLAAGRLPTFDFVAGPIDDAISQVEDQVSNSEVLQAIGDVRDALDGFSSIEQPQSLLGAPGYVAALTGQLNTLAQAGSRLQNLCVVTPQ